jgi:hypothetical protein
MHVLQTICSCNVPMGSATVIDPEATETCSDHTPKSHVQSWSERRGESGSEMFAGSSISLSPHERTQQTLHSRQRRVGDMSAAPRDVTIGPR